MNENNENRGQDDGKHQLGKITRIEELRAAREVGNSESNDTEPSIFRDYPQLQLGYQRACEEVNLCRHDREGSPVPIKQSRAAELIARLLVGVIGYDEHGNPFGYAVSWHPLTRPVYETAIAELIQAGITDADGVSYSYITSVIKLLSMQSVLSIAPAPAECIAFECGTGLNTKTGETYTSTPGWAPMWQLPYKYQSEVVEHPAIEWFLNFAVGDSATVKAIYAYLAAMIKGLHLQYILILKGRGGTGKGVITRLMTQLVGSANTFATDLAGLDDKHTIGFLYNKRLLVLSDIEAQHRSKSFSKLKNVTGGDDLTRNIKNGTIHNFTFTGLTVLTCNEDELGGRVDSGLKRRMLTVPLNNVAGEKQRKKYPNLEAEMRAEVPALIRKLVAMNDHSIRETLQKASPMMNEARDGEMFGDNSLVEFIQEFTVRGGDGDFIFVGNKLVVEGMAERIEYDSIKKIQTPLEFEHAEKHLYPAYLTYCQEHGIDRPLNSNHFSNEFIKTANLLGYEVRKGKDPIHRRAIIRGIRLSSDDSRLIC